MSHTWTYIISNLSWVTGEEQPHDFFKVDWFWGYIYRYTPVATPLDSTGIVYRQKLHRQTQLKRVQTAGLYNACVNCYEHILRMLASNLWLKFFFYFRFRGFDVRQVYPAANSRFILRFYERKRHGMLEAVNRVVWACHCSRRTVTKRYSTVSVADASSTSMFGPNPLAPS